MYSDLTFFTNEENNTLVNRFNKILKNNTQFFDVLVGYFRTSGFYELSKALEGVEKIRILVGLNVDKKTIELLDEANTQLYLSNKEIKEGFRDKVIEEMDDSDDSIMIENGIRDFIKFIKDGKLEMRAYPYEPLHAKVYIMRKDQEVSEDFGKVVTGSSNFSKSGLKGNLEFNVELKNSYDVKFALEKFEELWEKSVEITDEYVETVNKKTWLKEDITPYELYLKFLYEYFEDEINTDQTDFKGEFLPEGFKKFQYQIDAVNQAKKILNRHDGVFLADVVGLGKTYITALLARELRGGRKLFIVPPVLVDYWKRVLEDFGVDACKVQSLGKLDDIVENYPTDYFRYIFVDEAHRFRNDGTSNYTKLHEICLGKKVTLISATPQNNYTSDILNLIKLFQPKNNSNIIDDHPDIESFFSQMLTREKKLRKMCEKNPSDSNSRKLDECIKENSEQIRDKVLRKIMVRRVRSEIEKYYKEDMENQGLSFPKLGTPKQIVYEFDEEIDHIFETLLNLIENISYARYKTLTYLLDPPSDIKMLLIGQMNLKGFMKNLLIKRLESSFFAFSKTVERFKESHENFINMYEAGTIYISKKYNVYDLIGEDEDRLEELIEEGDIQKYIPEEFDEALIKDIKKDREILREIHEKITSVKTDPKLEYFIGELKNNPLLRDSKKIIFTESKETSEYLKKEIMNRTGVAVISYSGSSKGYLKDKIRANYDPDYQPKDKQQNEYNTLVTTDVLAEGINLHRANVLINYDLPWNPTRIMQRVGRINRVGTTFEELNVFNFFPTTKSNKHLSLKDNIINKIKSFHKTFGEDSKFLTEEEEVESYSFIGEKLYEELSKNLNPEEEGFEESELEYLQILRQIRDSDEDLFYKIKTLPKKSRSSKKSDVVDKSVVSFIKDGELKRTYISNTSYETKELTFTDAIRVLKCDKGEKRVSIEEDFYDMLNSNKIHFKEYKSEHKRVELKKPKKAGTDAKFKKMLKAFDGIKKKFTKSEDEKLAKLNELFEAGYLSKDITKKIVKEVDMVMAKNPNPHKLLEVAYEEIPEAYRRAKKQDVKATKGKVEVILSEYITS